MKNTNKNGSTVEVLYQRMGDRWYAFSLVGEDVFFGTVDPQAMAQAEAEQNEFTDFEAILNRELAKENSAA